MLLPMPKRQAGHLLLLLFVAASLAACSASPRNPSFDVSLADARADLRRMRDEPVPLQRPVVVIGGFADPMGLAPDRIAKLLREATGDGRILSIDMGGVITFDGARHKAIAAVEKAFPSGDPSATVEVDVVGFSMGGLVARAAAAPPGGESNDPRRLRIARLFTIATPHRGASAALLPLGPLVRDMTAGSDFLASLAEAERDAGAYPTYHYTRLGDRVVGEANAAPAGQTAWWVAPPWHETSHIHAYKDPRILADVARRLRGETPLAADPPAPLPNAAPAGKE